MYWNYSASNTLTFIQFSGIPNAYTLVNETTDTAHVVEIKSAVSTMDGNTVQCGFETFEEGIILSNVITFHIAPVAGESMITNINPLCWIGLVLHPIRLICIALVISTSTQCYMYISKERFMTSKWCMYTHER